jgi:curli biogenesis system outer membrane secretion channel CsgG
LPAWALAGVVALAACSTFDGSREYRVPPAAAGGDAPAARDRSGQRVVVLGHFTTPPNPLGWEDVGPGMSDALARTILNHGEFDVWINPELAGRVAGLINANAPERTAQLERLRQAYPAVRLVVTGRVTDFHHTTDVAATAGRKGWFGSGTEAVVAIQLNVFDLDLGRVVATDHLHGAASAPRGSTPEMYEGLAFDTYLFWSTPLGVASAEVVEESMAVLNRVVPTRDQSIRVVQQTEEPRRVRIAAGPASTLDRNERYYVYRLDETTGTLHPVLDRDTGQPLQARIESSSRIASTAWLLGRTPEDLDLRGAVLSTSPTAALAAGTLESGDPD